MKHSQALLFSMILPSLLWSQDAAGQGTKEQIQKMHEDPKAYIAMLENPQREAEQKPEEVVVALALRQGETIADIGAGTGYLLFGLRGTWAAAAASMPSTSIPT